MKMRQVAPPIHSSAKVRRVLRNTAAIFYAIVPGAADPDRSDHRENLILVGLL